MGAMNNPDGHSSVAGGTATAGEPYAGASAEEAFLALDGGEVHVLQDGPQDAPALLLIHGSASSARTWDAMVPALAAAHRVIRLDQLGHGLSAKPAEGGYGIEEQAGRAAAVLDRLGVARAVVAGHSGGGFVAVALAEQRPELVSALALVGTGPRLDAFTARAGGGIGPEQWPPDDEQIRRFASSGFHPGFAVPQELVDELRGMAFHAFAATAQASLAYLGRRPIPERLASLGKPVQVVYGELDARWEPASFAGYAAVPGARLDALPHCGHTPVLEDPAGTAALLLDFTAGLAAGAAGAAGPVGAAGQDAPGD